jgi:hypothetical protein
MKIKNLIRSSIAYPFTGRIRKAKCSSNKGVNALLHADDTPDPSRKRLTIIHKNLFSFLPLLSHAHFLNM